jgi:hypothetical protein
MREWDGAAWTNRFTLDASSELGTYRSQPWRWLAFPGWLLASIYALGLIGAWIHRAVRVEQVGDDPF